MSLTTKTSKKPKRSSKNAPKDEGLDPSWLFAVPSNCTLVEAGSGDEGGEFDWDAIKNNPNIELWLIRMPNNLQPKHLDSISLSLSSSRRPEKIGELTRKQATYNIWSRNVSQSDKNADGDEAVVCGEEMDSVTCLLPRKSKKNALYAAPKPISRHVIITAQPAQPKPQSASDASGAPVIIYQNPPRQSYPPELLKHRFMPYGSLAPVELGQEDKGAEKHKHKHKTKSKDNVDASMVVETNEISRGVDMEVDVVLQSSGKKDKMETKGKKIRHSRVTTDSVSQTTSEENRAIKKRKGSQELTEVAVEGKRSKKLKTKAV